MVIFLIKLYKKIIVVLHSTMCVGAINSFWYSFRFSAFILIALSPLPPAVACLPCSATSRPLLFLVSSLLKGGRRGRRERSAEVKAATVSNAPTVSRFVYESIVDSRETPGDTSPLRWTNTVVAASAAYRHEGSFMLLMRCFPAACSSDRLRYTVATVNYPSLFTCAPPSFLLTHQSILYRRNSSAILMWPLTNEQF